MIDPKYADDLELSANTPANYQSKRKQPEVLNFW